MATRVSLDFISRTSLNWLTQKTNPGLVQKCDVTHTGQVIADLLLKFPKFRYHGNKGQPEVNFNNTVILHDLKYPIWCTILWYICDISPVIANFVLKFLNFRCHGNKDQSSVNFNDSVKLHNLENPLFG